MQLEQLMSVKKLEEYIEKGLVSKRKHPKYDIYILNYTASCQFEWLWDEVTLNCRGLVVDSSWNILARPFPKFFSLEQLEGTNVVLERLNQTVSVMDKVDGSLGIIFKYNNEIIVSTRGSFESEQAIKALKIVEKYYSHLIKKGLTYLVEIVYPENKVVISYGILEDLILLSVIDTITGEVKLDEYKRVSEERNYLPN